MSTVLLDHVRGLAKSLRAEEKLVLIGELVSQIQGNLPIPQKEIGTRSLLGALADLGPAPSAEEIDEARREAWANFPRDDI
jgi:hypothetical protein